MRSDKFLSNLYHRHSQLNLRFGHDIGASTGTNYRAGYQNVSVKKLRTTFARQFPPMYKPITAFKENATEVFDSQNSAVWFRDKICSRGLYCDFCWFEFQMYTTFNLNFKVPTLGVGFNRFWCVSRVLSPVGFAASVREEHRKQFAGRTFLPSQLGFSSSDPSTQPMQCCRVCSP